MATEPRPGNASPDGESANGGDTGRQTSDPVGQRKDQGSSPTPAQSAPDAGGHDGQRDSGSSPARESDPAAGRDLPDENGEPPSVKRPGGNPEESEPPVENI
ncbi:hypothetical protein J5T34_19000 [Cupriavidus gilardii]|uniref:hypothetical protein n=1 Tax=Cupriavidus gilardii TaxID=82541 RepID=UPI001ABE9C33|nr:hypothetical protein [Cupriavidus gilardii]MBO4122819.1 hypothetical protein [Cupriavidus gilardii]